MDTEMVSGTYGETVLHPLAALRGLPAGAVRPVLESPKGHRAALCSSIHDSHGSEIIILGADFTMLRILIVAYFARVMIRGEFRSIGWNRLDTAMMLWSISSTVVTFLSHGSSGRPRVSPRMVA